MKSKLKIKWEVSPAPTGPYRSFHHRGWPLAHYKDEKESAAAQIQCEDAYNPSQVKTGAHAPLTLYVADYSQASPEKGAFVWMAAKTKCATLKEAKELLIRILEKYPQMMPKDKTNA